MMFVVDTNILLYAADKDSPEHAICRPLIEQWRGQLTPWYFTWGIIYEFLRVATHPRVWHRPWDMTRSWQFIRILLDSPGAGVLVGTERHAEVLQQTIEEFPITRGNAAFDLRTVALMREHGIRRIYTHDTDFHRFPFLDVADPLR